MSNTQQAALVQSTAEDAKSRLGAVVSLLNTKIADRAVFAGTNTGSDAIIDAETLLDELQIAIAAETTAAGVVSVIANW